MISSEALQALITTGETLAVEFKGEAHGSLNDRDLVQAVVCLANRRGLDDGWLLVAVEDDGRITGARPRHGAITLPDRVAALVAARTTPSVAVEVCEVPVKAATVLVLRVPPQRQEGVVVHPQLETRLHLLQQRQRPHHPAQRAKAAGKAQRPTSSASGHV